MSHLLRLLVLAIWAAYAPGLERSHDAKAIARAAVDAVLEDGAEAPVFGSHVEDLAVVAYFAARESSLVASAVGDGGEAHGPWQLHGAAGTAPLREQARSWLALLHEGAKRCPASPSVIMWGGCKVKDPLTGAKAIRLADRRVARAHALLVEAMGRDGVTELQAK